MIRPEDIETILTTHDLSVYLKDILQKEDRELKIDIDYQSGELFIDCPGFSNGLSVTTDPFGVWVISEAISQDNNGIFTQSGNLDKTEKTITVLRAVASWIRDFDLIAVRLVVPAANDGLPAFRSVIWGISPGRPTCTRGWQHRPLLSFTSSGMVPA
jgi:hypothetical protein